MRYSIKGWKIRSENAAKPMSQAAGFLVKWMRKMKPVKSALDYGCGKLRYARHLARRCSELTLVDSKVQLEREQIIGGRSTTVDDYVRAYLPHARTLPAESFVADSRRYDFILCANVLSAIPSKKTRSDVLRGLSTSLKHGRKCLFVTQYTNSYFTKIRSSPKAKAHLDGWIVESARGCAFYGVLNKSALASLVGGHGFALVDSWTEGQSAYVLAARE